ncbi:tRNA(Ile)-lysidine synthase [Shewanella sairae]|uniref:tRNA(Ile)-lysidine synthase n=1 Tax=Shewanella sairae TaxID=190310 RepID=A0ABQ4PHS2_9GAMM|nr:tRNA lysidine(34) synthetase TilS [Shewanella sairae]MCL1131267.1 tRNA lysidine(34) synthetase TilS [Shewanella sairae]GIU46937.1 tRNA(Ile)-lysidine synthase [Shewanella sairae]
MNIVSLIQLSLHQLTNKLAAEPNPLMSSAQKRKLVLAYSGGVDSEILAHGLGQFAKVNADFECVLVHVHHGLSNNADAWVEHCISQANSYDLACNIKYVEVKQAPRVSVEAQARSVRYQALLSELSSNDILMTAHHQDDQLETVLLALKRGLGPKGLSAMGKVQRFNQQHWLIRPLLDCSKEQIEQYARQHNIVHIEDESNFDDKYDRNFLRLDIIPKLKHRWSAIAATASRSAELCALQQSVLEEETIKRLPQVQQQLGCDNVLELTKLADFSDAWQSLLLRGHMEQLGFAPPSKVQGEQILSQLLDAKADASIELRLTDVTIRRFKNNAYFLANETGSLEVSPQQQHCTLQQTNISLEDLLTAGISLPSGECLSAENIVDQTQALLRLPLATEKVSIVFALVGSTRCHPHFRSKGRELKKLWQELELPPWKRGRVPLLCYDGKLVAAVGYWIEKSALAHPETSGLRLTLR